METSVLTKRGLAAMLAVVAAAVFAASCAPQQPSKAPQRRVVRKAMRTKAPVPPPPAPYVAPGRHTVETRLAQFGWHSRQRWKPFFEHAGVRYPPASVELVSFKKEKKMQVYAGPSPYRLSLVRTLDIYAASGGSGPKLREGDEQVPEGVYSIESFYPNSQYHVGLLLDYPNDFDRLAAERDGRHRLGSSILIHGSNRSIGCIAVGDVAAEDLFTLAADSGLENVSVLILPRDFRRTGEREPGAGQPPWVGTLYARLDDRLRQLPARGRRMRQRVETPDGRFYDR